MASPPRPRSSAADIQLQREARSAGSRGSGQSDLPRASSIAAGTYPVAGRSCMIDGIAISPEMLQTLRGLQPDALKALVTKTSFAKAADGVVPSLPQSFSPNVASDVEVPSAGVPKSTTPLAQRQKGQTATSSPREAKRRRTPDCACTELSPDAARPSSPLMDSRAEVDSAPADSNGSQSETEDAHLEQLISLRLMVDHLAHLATENSERIHGFNLNIANLLHTKAALGAQVDMLNAQLQQQQMQITDLQNHMQQMHFQAAVSNTETLQRSSSSSSHFDL